MNHHPTSQATILARRLAKNAAFILAAAFAASIMLAKPVGYSVETAINVAAVTLGVLVIISLVAGLIFVADRTARSLKTHDAGTGRRLMVWLGAGVTVFFALLYSTTVEIQGGGAVHNIGLMNDRLVGVIVGLALVLFGLLRRR